MRIPLPDMSGPPVWWDVAVGVLAVVGVANAVRWRMGHTSRLAGSSGL